MAGADLIWPILFRRFEWRDVCFKTNSTYSKDSISGIFFMQSLVSHLHKNLTYRMHFVWYCAFWFHQDRSIYMKILLIYRPTYLVLSVLLEKIHEVLLCLNGNYKRLLGKESQKWGEAQGWIWNANTSAARDTHIWRLQAHSTEEFWQSSHEVSYTKRHYLMWKWIYWFIGSTGQTVQTGLPSNLPSWQQGQIILQHQPQVNFSPTRSTDIPTTKIS